MESGRARRQFVRNGKIEVPGPDERALVHRGGERLEWRVVA
jgi:hypothetical protein